jgi:hypothetical protein
VRPPGEAGSGSPSAFEQFVAFPQDGVDDHAFLAKGKLAMPALAIGAAGAAASV